MRIPMLSTNTLRAAFLLCGLAACATPTPYQPVVDDHGGYRTEQVGNQHFLVSFTGNEVTPRETVESFLLYRAAQITVQSGNDYFIVVNRDTERSTTYWFTGDPLGAWWPSYYTFGFTPGPFPVAEAARPVDSYKAVATIAVGKGAKPGNVANSYEARAVLHTLDPLVQQSISQAQGQKRV